ncbi:MAG: hypothetical protein OEZ43_13395 [Gammaproteobacteria bacterium]|nr:hypothetical protein [Gammaproteobacteria bacterium]
MHNYRLDKENKRLELVFEDSVNQEEFYLIAKELVENDDNCHIVFDMSALDDMNSDMLGTIIALKAAFGWSSDKIELLGCNQDMRALFSQLQMDQFFTMH